MERGDPMARQQLKPTDEDLQALRTLNLSEAAVLLNRSRNLLRRWRDEYLPDIDRHPRGRPYRDLPPALEKELGLVPDAALSSRYEVPLSTVRNRRRKRGLPVAPRAAATTVAAVAQAASEEPLAA